MKIHWKLIIYQNFRVVFQISRPGNIPQKWFSTQNEPLGVTFQMRLTPTMEASNFWRNQAKSMMHPFKNTFKGCTMLSVWFFKKWKVPMVGVSLIWKVTPRGSFWVLNHFWGIFLGRDSWKATLNFWSMINFQCIFIYLVHNSTATVKILHYIWNFFTPNIKMSQFQWNNGIFFGQYS